MTASIQKLYRQYYCKTIIQSISFCKQEATQTARADHAAVLKALPFSDRQSLADAKRGFVAPVLNDGVVKKTEDRVV
ncbi:MAG: hypothetical protein JRF56_19425 [Deltaproteobacteria bacterium]|nr:hypothetical protein [Deltaproteobacteria bacterium]